MNQEKSQEMINELFETILSLNTIEDCDALFADLCTFKEIEQMSQRIRAARLLLDGKTYSEVITDTDISSATLSRVSRCIKHGSGGYKKFIAK